MQQVLFFYVVVFLKKIRLHRPTVLYCNIFVSILHNNLGYRYSIPFLSVDSGIHIEDNFVQPLYKHIFNIEHPTMVFIGLADLLGAFHTVELEVNFIHSKNMDKNHQVFLYYSIIFYRFVLRLNFYRVKKNYHQRWK